MVDKVLRNFEDILNAVKDKAPKRVAVAVAQDDAIMEAVQGAREQKIAEFILVGDREKIHETAGKLGVSLEDVQIIHEPDDRKAAYRAVALVSGGQADVLMKGLINTADLLRAVLDKEIGLRTGRVLSHTAVYELPGFDRLLMVTDGGMNIAPTLQQKADIIQNSVQLARVLGISPAKVAVLAAVEVINPDMPATLEAAALTKMADRGQIKGAIVDGPLALDNAISLEAASHKGIKSPVAGMADILVTPDIVAGNILGKSLVYIAKGKIAGLVLGAAKPVVVTSRADTHEAKLMSIALGALLG
ncbi:phosphate butyryltransferase [Sporomusa sphaeroides]|uniref:Phosphate acetyltransferase n=2 Tax=Sporomusa TaxID=2375 RepID=A0ABP2CEZ3_9FIRM|nr:phosphate butyryltransferase [Sporomusa sphaeroides]OLS57805.1 phosphate acetyltransferase [Sporomusa sphaeroides DSM 2875]CVK20980.1 Phosphate acetyltransferase [Sporomusa sphaeroides DSM 2875]SCM80820.1 Phosphate butyryltransferase [uncultured Sporomusa sp.]